MKQDSTINTSFKNIKDFTPEDTIYITRMRAGHSYHYFCQFEKLERGMVYGRVISVEPNPSLHIHEHGKTVSARVKACYLFGNNPGDLLKHNYCHWFNRNNSKGFAL